MYDAILSLCERIVYQHSISGAVPGPEGNIHPIFVPFGLFRAKDGWVAIGVPNDNFWRKLCGVMKRKDLAEDERTATKFARRDHRELVVNIVTEWTSPKTKQELTDLLGGIVPFGPVNTAEDIFNDRHVERRNMIVPVEHPGSSTPTRITNSPIRMQTTPGGVWERAPYLGEDTDAILLRLGYSKADIEDFKQRKLVG